MEISLQQEGISDVTNDPDETELVLIIHRKMENNTYVQEEKAKLSEIAFYKGHRSSDIRFKETLIVADKVQGLKNYDSPEMRHPLTKSAYVVIERLIACRKSLKTGKFEEVVDKEKLWVNKDKHLKMKRS